VEGEPLEIAFNARYLMDVLNALDSPQVVLEMTTPSSPGVFRPFDVEGRRPELVEGFTHVIMPMHIAR
ncbi:MAG TPA: DNA polymerase III subunit beta, partial [Anaerolineae bacterium]|nr:DNA polymerase III subunit beta [Anaerolineae bacterium]